MPGSHPLMARDMALKGLPKRQKLFIFSITHRVRCLAGLHFAFSLVHSSRRSLNAALWAGRNAQCNIQRVDGQNRQAVRLVGNRSEEEPNIAARCHRCCYNILSGYLSVVTTVFSQQDGIYGFKFAKRFLEISSRDLTLLSILII